MLILFSSPTLGFHIMDVHMLALLDGRNGLADVLAVFPDGVARLDVPQRHLMADRDVLLGTYAKIGIVVSDDTEHIGAGFQTFDDDHGDRVLMVMREAMGGAHGDVPREIQEGSFREGSIQEGSIQEGSTERTALMRRLPKARGRDRPAPIRKDRRSLV
jgi:hypothetical protein